MKVLVLEEAQEMAELLSLYLKSLGVSEVKFNCTVDETKPDINDPSYSVWMVNKKFLSGPNELLYKAWRESHPDKMVVLIGDSLPAAFNKDSGVRFLNSQHLVSELKDLVKMPFWRALQGDFENPPLPLSPELVFKIGIFPADLFLKLGENNWIKIFHKGTPFGTEERAKFESKKVRHFHVLADDVHQALSYFEDMMTQLSSKTEDLRLVADAQEFLFNAIKESGFSPQVQSMAIKASESALKIISKNKALEDLFLKAFRFDQSWLSKHTLTTLHISCGLAHEMGWGGEQTMNKMAIATFMHDMKLTDQDISEKVFTDKIISNPSLKNNDPQLKNFLLHPIDGSQLVQRFKEIPPDTDKIILVHHENPEGNGFPRATPAHQISPLGSLFIMAHEAASLIVNSELPVKEWTMAKLVGEMNQEKWQHGSFRKLWPAFEKLKLFPSK